MVSTSSTSWLSFRGAPPCALECWYSEIPMLFLGRRDIRYLSLLGVMLRQDAHQNHSFAHIGQARSKSGLSRVLLRPLRMFGLVSCEKHKLFVALKAMGKREIGDPTSEPLPNPLQSTQFHAFWSPAGHQIHAIPAHGAGCAHGWAPSRGIARSSTISENLRRSASSA